jgi:hypothetical protein
MPHAYLCFFDAAVLCASFSCFGDGTYTLHAPLWCLVSISAGYRFAWFCLRPSAFWFLSNLAQLLLLRLSSASPAATPHSRGATQVQRHTLHTHISYTSHSAHRHSTQHTKRTLHTHTHTAGICMHIRFASAAGFQNNCLYLTVQQSTHACRKRLCSPRPFVTTAHNHLVDYLRNSIGFPQEICTTSLAKHLVKKNGSWN